MSDHIGKNIRKLRLDKGYSQQYLGLKTGMSQFIIHCIEAGKKIPDPDQLQKIADALEVKPDLLQSVTLQPFHEAENNHNEYITTLEYMGKIFRIIYKK